MIDGDLTAVFTISTGLIGDHVLNVRVMAAGHSKKENENENF
jgi:hypothetical protein